MLEGLRDVPYLTLWGIWLERNASLFEDSLPLPSRSWNGCLGMVPYYKQARGPAISKIDGRPQVDKSKPWGDLDGGCQGQEKIVNIGFVYYLNESHY